MGKRRVVVFGREFWIVEDIAESWFLYLAAKVDIGGESPGACWTWTGKPNYDGYGTAAVNRKTVLAHRALFRCLVGDPPEGCHLHHRCENKRCVNPDHLQPLTPLDHMAVTPQAMAHYFTARTHCKNGHELIPENLVRQGENGIRRCKICVLAWANRKNALLREARPPKTPQTHCKHGHEWTEENTRIYKGKKFCRACHNAVTTMIYHARTKEMRAQAMRGEVPVSAVSVPRVKDRTHCQRGHPLGEKTNGKARACLICQGWNSRLAYYKKRENVIMIAKIEALLGAKVNALDPQIDRPLEPNPS